MDALEYLLNTVGERDFTDQGAFRRSVLRRKQVAEQPLEG